MKNKYSTEEFKDMIDTNWNQSSLSFYLAQVLSGECSIKETIEDLLSLNSKP